MPGGMDGFTPSSTNTVKMNPTSSPKKFNLNVSESKVKSDDYTRPTMDQSQTPNDTDHRINVGEGYMDMSSDLEYPNVSEVNDNRKNPVKTTGKPGIRENRFDSFAETGLPPEGIKVFEDETPVLEDDGGKHGSLNKWQFTRDEKGKTGP